MNITGIHHIAFAHSPNSAINSRLETVLGLTCVHSETGEGFVERTIGVGDCFFQTLEATTAGTVERFVSRRGDGLHHVAFEVDDVDAAVSELLSKDVEMIDSAPRSGGMGTRIAFIHPRAMEGLLVELVEAR